ncbi:hypothetical protein GLOIN_2v619746 [Rhizophagus clarus]|uniref:Uncharacterized protein n=1 Tax=Rhizophagus clarus TaxID=94130 RepID=A0A8H3LHP6_9GLOM|nr:hypothetical protein GLOIN_2v619746 [Rhizophagus clarus]
MVYQQNNADTKLMEEIPKVADKEIGDLISYEPNLPADPTVPASPSICEEDRITDEFLNVTYKKRMSGKGSERRNFQDDSLPESDKRRSYAGIVTIRLMRIESGISDKLSSVRAIHPKLRRKVKTYNWKKYIKDEWGAGEHCGERTHPSTCWNALQHGIPIIM